MSAPTTETKTVFFIMVAHPFKGWIRAGKPYQTRAIAHSWVRFVKASWRGLPTKVVAQTITYINGKVSDESRRILDEKFNMYVEE